MSAWQLFLQSPEKDRAYTRFKKAHGKTRKNTWVLFLRSKEKDRAFARFARVRKMKESALPGRDNDMTRTEKTVIGAGAGALIGGLATHSVGGAVIGGLGGGLIGSVV